MTDKDEISTQVALGILKAIGVILLMAAAAGALWFGLHYQIDYGTNHLVPR